jgi:hypothetical protein
MALLRQKARVYKLLLIIAFISTGDYGLQHVGISSDCHEGHRGKMAVAADVAKNFCSCGSDREFVHLCIVLSANL